MFSSMQRAVTSSISSIDVGSTPAASTAFAVCAASSMRSKIAIAVRAKRGLLNKRSVTSVIVPNVPSAPVKSARKL